MKILAIIIGVLLIVFVGIQLYSLNSRNTIEKYSFQVVKKYDSFEVRKYKSGLFTAVDLSTNEYSNGSRKGFSILAGYIFGGNDSNQKIAMTSPVRMSIEEEGMTMMFLIPKEFNKENLPKPNQPDIEFRMEPEQTLAVISFGGWANSDKIEEYKNKLKDALEKQGIEYTNNFSFFGYNPPYDILFRKNEVVVQLK